MSHADSSTVANREWRFKPERTCRIPSSWADNGRHEVAEDGEEQVYAVQLKLGVLLRWTIDGSGSPVDGPHRDKPAVRVCYVTRDGREAYVRDWDVVLEDGRAVPERDFASVIAIDLSDADPVDDDSNRSWYREALQDRYDVAPIVADGGQPASETDRTPFDSCPECEGSLGCPSRSDRICQDCGEEFCHETRGDRHLLWSFDDDYRLNEVVARAE